MTQPPRHVTARDLRPGDVVVLDPGDTRQLHWVESVSSGELFGCDWGDGRHSLLDAGRVVVLIHRPGDTALPQEQTSARIEGDTLGGEDGTTTAEL